MLESCDNRAGSAKRHGNVFPRHAEWPQVADAVIEAEFYTNRARPSTSLDVHPTSDKARYVPHGAETGAQDGHDAHLPQYAACVMRCTDSVRGSREERWASRW
jgi:hypothetical protein